MLRRIVKFSNLRHLLLGVLFTFLVANLFFGSVLYLFLDEQLISDEHGFQIFNPNCSRKNFELDSEFYQSYMRRKEFDLESPNPLPGHKYHFAVYTSPKKYLARRAIRKTWKRFLELQGNSSCSGSVRFYMGQTGDPKVARDVQRELLYYSHDVVLMDFCDMYNSLPLKTLGLMRYLDKYLPSTVEYVVKIDDDVFPNLPAFFDCFPKVTSGLSGLFGWAELNESIRLDSWDKYRVPQSAYNGSFFPTFLHGPAYTIRKTDLPALLETAQKTPFINLEDVWFTGIVANKTGLKRTDIPQFMVAGKSAADIRSNKLKTDKAGLFYHGLGPLEVRKFWQNMTLCCGCTRYCWPYRPKQEPRTTTSKSPLILDEIT